MDLLFHDVRVEADFVLAERCGDLIATGFFEKSRIKVKSAGARLGLNVVRYRWNNYGTKNDEGWNIAYSKLSMGGKGRDFFYYALAVSKEVGTRYIVTTEKNLHQDFYSYLMHNYKLPLLREWAEPLHAEMVKERMISSLSLLKECDDPDRTFPLHGEDVRIKDLIVFRNETLTEESLEEVVSELLKNGKIRITDSYIPPLKFEGLDAYFKKYGHTIIGNLEKEVQPLSPLVSKVDEIALKHKRLLPQQAACVAGIRALRKSGVRYGIMNEGMGTGKTVQAASLMDAYHVDEWLRKHPGKTVKDAYQDGVINYRAIIDCPGQLLEKWAREIEEEIPFAKVRILKDFSQLIAIRESGKKPTNGKEFFVISKDLAKLGTQLSPIPTQVKTKQAAMSICVDCYKQENTIVEKVGSGDRATCPECGGHHFMARPYARKAYGMICPSCGELLLRSNGKKVQWDKLEDEGTVALGPKDFAQKRSDNAICYHCGTQLWGANSKPIDCGGDQKPRRSVKWRKISYARNLKGKTKETAFVLKCHEDEFTDARGVTNKFEYMASEYGPRKVAPAHYIKKYLKGYFSFCILDECHKFEGAGSAQSVAAHALIEASDFTVGLTGTISNGTAASFYYLLFMLEPHRMIERSFTWSSHDCMRFCQQYGCVETLYEADGEGTYNSNSRGKQLGSPKVKPGISPLLFVDFLLDRCVFLDITDLSRYLPPLHEKVVTVKLPSRILSACKSTIRQLKEASHSREGQSVLSEMLQFGLSYPDKPFGRYPIKSAYVEDQIVANVDNFPEYENQLLPKEEELVKIVNAEIADGRSMFVYCSYTGKAETNITERLKKVIEDNCNLKNRVQILQSSSPAPIKREAWIKEKASKGVKVIITNPKCVETGLDFCFTHEGACYNYPTLIFYQMSYEMSVIWQASRRAYRLNQKEECRTYYLAYEGTLQTAALQIMAEKQLATSAIQGKFSSEGLTAMAKGVDTRVQLAAALAKNDMSDRNTLENMFDALNQSNNDEKGDGNAYEPPLTYYELVGMNEADEKKAQGEDGDTFNIFDFDYHEPVQIEERKEETKTAPIMRTVETSVPIDDQSDPFAMFDEFFNAVPAAPTTEAKAPEAAKPAKKRVVKKPAKNFGQYDLFAEFAS